MEGHLCRCTGYRSIYDGFKTFAKDLCCQRGPCSDDSSCCKNKPESKHDTSCCLFDLSSLKPYDPSQELIFPPELMLDKSTKPSSLDIKGTFVRWLRPSSLKEALDLKKSYPAAIALAGMIGAGFGKNSSKENPTTVLSLSHIPELNAVKVDEKGVTFGAAVSMATLESTLRDVIQSSQENKTRSLSAMLKMVALYGSVQIKHAMSISSNILPASSTSDLNTVLIAVGAHLVAISTEGQKRTILCDDKFLLSPGKTSLADNEILFSVHIPFTTNPSEYISFYRQSRRHANDTAIVNAAFRVHLDKKDNGYSVVDSMIVYGGVGSTTVIARKAMESIKGRAWDESIVSHALTQLQEELVLAVDLGQVEYRQSLIQGFFFKFYSDVSNVITNDQPMTEQVSIPFKSSQTFEPAEDSQKEEDMIGRPLAHTTAIERATGVAQFVDDIPQRRGELYIVRLLSDRAHAKILSIDVTEALDMPGVEAIIQASDVPGTNNIGVIPDEEIFAKEKVVYAGQPIAAVVAETKDEAQRAAKKVKVVYEDLPAIITIKDAIAANSFFEESHSIVNGDVDSGFDAADHVLEGEMYVGGQDHYYIETHTSLAIPGENNEMEIYCSSQFPSYIQGTVSQVLNIPSNRIVVRTKNVGGAFGGKIFRASQVACAVAVAAYKTGKPVRCALDRDDDMQNCGHREDYLVKYKVGCSKDGQIVAFKAVYFGNSGAALDLSILIMEKLLLNLDNCYKIPNIDVTGRLCKTNIAPNTAMRGLGSSQGILFTESLMSDIAKKCGIPERKVREQNMYKEGNLTHFNQSLRDCTIRRVWSEMMSKSHYENRRLAVDSFNKQNKWKKRGIFVMPGKYGIGFTIPDFMQSGALVSIYTDGTVRISHGGVEIGQGLHTKMVQVAANALGIPVSKVFNCAISTDTVPNSSVTGGSYSSDINGMAVKDACDKLSKRIKPYKVTNPDGKWEDWVQAAYADHVSLSSTGYYQSRHFTYSWKTNLGQAFKYFVYGACCCEVEVDCLTGDHTILRADIVVDIGKSLNPAIDIGQIEGGFIQGAGMYTIEELRFSPDGRLLTTGPKTYKIPTSADIPKEFNVHILKESRNDQAIHASKGSGEFSVLLAPVVFLAIKNAVNAARCDIGLDEIYRFDSPATCERIRMACGDQLKNKLASI
ncbi:xanthine dehydrogenase/oxidase-like isoform X2 [Actinia tenebrosa]|uniref:Xanthine dehydrogenase/oxidase-like isoform X1 n=1 Tax=Actinia tenebrosa TaxID=6105 RepID=A0A6P8IZV5_ACTTE|nr:xanthine dehydrogenase/oxidase-like isoform X1 [Actinia tenebrosa]XP_031572744.1 xanthine dehydrogenase/oxidase-like isoform X2 [Actinia tenebrosa]